ncbi:hypothetical protein CBS101457_000303 [Exobasidium rhododendri]|nr:hypothetical protein CBS101457_000303 [Exobasidium rhododendri]
MTISYVAIVALSVLVCSYGLCTAAPAPLPAPMERGGRSKLERLRLRRLTTGQGSQEEENPREPQSARFSRHGSFYNEQGVQEPQTARVSSRMLAGESTTASSHGGRRRSNRSTPSQMFLDARTDRLRNRDPSQATPIPVQRQSQGRPQEEENAMVDPRYNYNQGEEGSGQHGHYVLHGAGDGSGGHPHSSHDNYQLDQSFENFGLTPQYGSHAHPHTSDWQPNMHTRYDMNDSGQSSYVRQEQDWQHATYSGGSSSPYSTHDWQQGIPDTHYEPVQEYNFFPGHHGGGDEEEEEEANNDGATPQEFQFFPEHPGEGNVYLGQFSNTGTRHEDREDDPLDYNVTEEEEPSPTTPSRPISQFWATLKRQGRHVMIELLYDYTGFARKAIVYNCHYRLTKDIARAMMEGTEEQKDAAYRALFNVGPGSLFRYEGWMKNLSYEQVQDILQGMAAASDRSHLFTYNFISRMDLKDDIIMQILHASQENRTIIAEELLMTQKSEEALRARNFAQSIPKRGGLGIHPWSRDLDEKQRKAVIAKLNHFVNARGPPRGAQWCLGKLKLAGQEGLGRRILEADDFDMNIIGEYIFRLQTKNANTLVLPAARQ